MRVFVDTSGLFAVLDDTQLQHDQAARLWDRLIECAELVTTNYVLVEAGALAQRRLGLRAVTDIEHNMRPLMEVVWIDASIHNQAIAATILAGRPDWGLVDASALHVMREAGVEFAFSFDRHFAEAGFPLPPLTGLPASE